MKTHHQRKHANAPRGNAQPKPAGEQAISMALYQQIRQAVRELGPSEQ